VPPSIMINDFVSFLGAESQNVEEFFSISLRFNSRFTRSASAEKIKRTLETLTYESNPMCKNSFILFYIFLSALRGYHFLDMVWVGMIQDSIGNHIQHNDICPEETVGSVFVLCPAHKLVKIGSTPLSRDVHCLCTHLYFLSINRYSICFHRKPFPFLLCIRRNMRQSVIRQRYLP